MKIKTTKEELLKTKFLKTILLLEGYLMKYHKTDYDYTMKINTVNASLEEIKKQFFKDLQSLSEDIEDNFLPDYDSFNDNKKK